MLREVGQVIDRLDLFARGMGEGIEFQPCPVLFDNGNFGTGAALEALAPVDPGRERFQCTRQRLHLADAAARVGFAEPQFLVRILARQQLFERPDRAHVGEAEPLDQRVTILQRLLEQPAGIEEDHGNAGIDIRHHLEQRRRFRAERGYQRKPLAADDLERPCNHFRWRGVAEHIIERGGRRQLRGADNFLMRNYTHCRALSECRNWLRRCSAERRPSPVG